MVLSAPSETAQKSMTTQWKRDGPNESIKPTYIILKGIILKVKGVVCKMFLGERPLSIVPVQVILKHAHFSEMKCQ